MKNVVFDLGGVVVDWSPERLMEEYTGDRAMPVSLFERGFFRKFWPDYDRGTIDQVNIVREMSVFSGRPYAECWDFVEFIRHCVWGISRNECLINSTKSQHSA